MRQRTIWAGLALFWLGTVLPASAALNVRDFGATGAGVVDDSGAVQAALDVAGAAGGGAVYLPPGDYRLDSPLTIPSGVALQGIGRNPASSGSEGSGSRLLAHAASGEGLLALQSEAAVEGVTIFYPDQSGSTVYPPAIVSTGDRTVVRWVHLVNPWIGLSYTADTNDHLVRGVTGQPLHEGVTGFPGGRIEVVTFKPDWNAGHVGSVGIGVRGPHATEIFDCAIAGFATAVRLHEAFHVLMTNVTASATDAALRAAASGETSFAAIANCQSRGRIVTDAAASGRLTFTGCHVESGEATPPLVQAQGAGPVTFKACTFIRPAGGADNIPTVDVAPAQPGGAPLIITSSIFEAASEDAVHLRLSANAREALIGANVMTGAVTVVNNAPAHASVLIENNAVRPLAGAAP